ncbi:MAG TPA: prepilin-type N-terminal cleavage/methylation domain-containing protein [Ramlibacter sp.]|uniref:prepilin-type N-terminal cleavage/methylation domain-containing protein n=1 Tax=Ramlibacter sp. TaxID=1917967 RepID=UPI002D7E712B|nr:prepilin-type N-terminal cleavage/methylation domain-containing protein [Ramlibacter sp.]HET8744783.1 prepilin-type N-terminal cleavage/methylation domain-containing protein [Ramlibacter sp.]
MRTSAPGNSQPPAIPRRRATGFTLLELLVVIAIIALGSAGVAFALRDAGGNALERDAQRLAALLESARARSRLSGEPVRWIAADDGFRFEGLPPETLPNHWLAEDTQVSGRRVLVLGPEPVIGPQAVVLTSAGHPERTLRIATDGLRPFTVGPVTP